MKARVPKQAGASNMNQLMIQAKKMQDEVARVTEELKAREFEIKAGGGLVRIVIDGDKQIKALEISPDIVDADDIETLQDVIIAAVNEAVTTVETVSQEELEKVTGGFNIPGM